jgi:hypothetical protein
VAQAAARSRAGRRGASPGKTIALIILDGMQDGPYHPHEGRASDEIVS